jgi:hypothetical protein
MPWKSDKQRAWGNSPAGHKALGDAGVAEWNSASKGKTMNKGYQSASVAMAAGGPVLGRTRSFMKPDGLADQFTGGRLPTKESDPTKQDYGSKGAVAKRTGDKALPTVKPRK